MEFPSFSFIPNISNFSNFSVDSYAFLSKLKNTVDAVCHFVENNQILNSIKKIPETIKPLFEKVKQINPSSIMAKFNLTTRKVVVIDKNLPDAPSSLIKTGDLVYGLTGSRKVFLNQHVPDNEETFNRLKGARVTSGKKRAVLADTLNNQFLGTG
jgi:hypothetical protein